MIAEPRLAPQVSPPGLKAMGVVTGNSFLAMSWPSTYSWARPGALALREVGFPGGLELEAELMLAGREQVVADTR